MREWMQPWPKWPYIAPRTAVLVVQRLQVARGSRRPRSGGTAESSQPGQWSCRRAGRRWRRGRPRGLATARLPPFWSSTTEMRRGGRSSFVRSHSDERLRLLVAPRPACRRRTGRAATRPARARQLATARRGACAARCSSSKSRWSMPSRPIGPVLHDLAAVRRRLAEVVVADDDAARGGAGPASSISVASQRGHARALGADERARDVEAVLGQQLVEVVARDAAGDCRPAVARADRVGVAVAQVAQVARRSRPCARPRRRSVELVLLVGADPQAHAVVGERPRARATLSEVRGPGPYSWACTEWMPHELLPTLPPIVQ